MDNIVAINVDGRSRLESFDAKTATIVREEKTRVNIHFDLKNCEIIKTKISNT